MRFYEAFTVFEQLTLLHQAAIRAVPVLHYLCAPIRKPNYESQKLVKIA